MAINGSVTGSIVAAPEDKKISDKFAVLEFPLYSDRRIKNRDTGEWESDPKGTTKVRIVAKFDARDLLLAEQVQQGDIVKVTGTFYEREYDKKDGTKGRSLESDYIESVEFVSRSRKYAPADDLEAAF